MPAPKTKPTVTTRESAKAKTDADARLLDHVSRALEAAQGDLASVGGSLGSGARDLRMDVERLLRDARRDLKKMSQALQRDRKHSKDVTKTAKKGHTAVKNGSASGGTANKDKTGAKTPASR